MKQNSVKTAHKQFFHLFFFSVFLPWMAVGQTSEHCRTQTIPMPVCHYRLSHSHYKHDDLLPKLCMSKSPEQSTTRMTGITDLHIQTCIQYNICMHEQFNHLHNLRTLEKNLCREVLEDNITQELTGTGKHSDILTLKRSAKESTTLHSFTPLIYTCTWSCSSSTEIYQRWYHAPKHLTLGILIYIHVYIHENIPTLQRFSRKGNSGVTRFTTPLSWDTLVCWDVPALQRLTKDTVTSHNITFLEHASTGCIKFNCSFTSQHQKPKTGCCTVSVF